MAENDLAVTFTKSQIGWMREAYLRAAPLRERAKALRDESVHFQEQANAISRAAFDGVLSEVTPPSPWEPVFDPKDADQIPIGLRKAATKDTCEGHGAPAAEEPSTAGKAPAGGAS